MLNSESLGPKGTFWIFSGICALVTLFTFIWVKETKGLTDDQCKHLYSQVEVVKSVEPEARKQEEKEGEII